MENFDKLKADKDLLILKNNEKYRKALGALVKIATMQDPVDFSSVPASGDNAALVSAFLKLRAIADGCLSDINPTFGEWRR